MKSFCVTLSISIFSIFLCFFILEANGMAVTRLVADINPNGDSDPSYLNDFNGKLVFSANDGNHGVELWISDGNSSPPRMIKDINLGTNSSNPNTFATVNNQFFFQAADGINGAELWRSDGTLSGTVMVKDINGSGSSYPYELTALDTILLFSANDGSHGRELWKSDGNPSGTTMVTDINSTGDGYPQSFYNFNEMVFFSADDGASTGVALWKSDGMTTTMVKDMNPTPANIILCLRSVDNLLFFTGNDDVHGYELWKTNGIGIARGTAMVKDINPSGSGVSVGIGDSIETTNVDGILYFAANDGVHGYELWKSDGTDAGTIMVKDIHPSGDGIVIDDDNKPTIENVHGTVFFAANDGVHGVELWKSDGTDTGTVMVKNINPYGDGLPSVRDGRFLINFGGELIFCGNDGVNGVELYKSDGTSSGSQMLMDINPNGHSNPAWGTISGNTFYFVADDGNRGRELWKYEREQFDIPLFLPAILNKKG